MANRDDYLELNEEVGDRDLLTNCINRSFWPDKSLKAVVKSVEVGRPDLLAKRILGNSELWWILLKFNKIDDPWNELWPGQIILIPDTTVIQSYLDEYKVY